MAQLPNNPKTGKPFKSDKELQKFVLDFLKGPTRIEKPRDPEADEPQLFESGGTGKIAPKKDIPRIRHQDELREAKEQYQQNIEKMNAALALLGGGKGGAKPTRALPKGMRGNFVKTIADLAKHQPKTAAKIDKDIDTKLSSKSPRQPAKKAGSPPRIVDQPKGPKSVKEPPSVFERLSTQVTESFEKQKAIHKKANDAYNKLERLRKQLPRPKQEVIDKAEADYKKAEAEARTALKKEQAAIAKKEDERRQYERTRAPIRKKPEPKRPETEGKTMTLRGKQPSPRVASQPRPTDKPKLSIGMDGVVRKPEQSRPKPPEPPKDGVRRKPKLSLVPEPKPVEMPKRKPMEQAKLDTIKKLQEQNPANLIYGKKDPPKSEMTRPKLPEPMVEGARSQLMTRGPFDKPIPEYGPIPPLDMIIKVIKSRERPPYRVLSETQERIAKMFPGIKQKPKDTQTQKIFPSFTQNPVAAEIFRRHYPETIGMSTEQVAEYFQKLTGGAISKELLLRRPQIETARTEPGDTLGQQGGAKSTTEQDYVFLPSNLSLGETRMSGEHEYTHFVDPYLSYATKMTKTGQQKIEQAEARDLYGKYVIKDPKRRAKLLEEGRREETAGFVMYEGRAAERSELKDNRMYKLPSFSKETVDYLMSVPEAAAFIHGPLRRFAAKAGFTMRKKEDVRDFAASVIKSKILRNAVYDVLLRNSGYYHILPQQPQIEKDLIKLFDIIFEKYRYNPDAADELLEVVQDEMRSMPA